MIKTVITSAGRGTRLLPATKEIPKEMLPIFTRNNGQIILTPLLQLIFEDLHSVGIKDYCFVVGREKRSVEDHFTQDDNYLQNISDNSILLEFYKKINNSNLFWINQNKPLGFGDAVKLSESFVGPDNFIVHAGDTAFLGKQPIIRLIQAGEKNVFASAVLLCKKVKNPKKYGIATLKKVSNHLYDVIDVDEKPEKPKSDFAIMPTYFFTPKIFQGLSQIKPGKNNEYQLTDAIKFLINKGEKVIAIMLNRDEIELDVGTTESYRHAQNISYKKAMKDINDK